ncbi:MarR family transcriptional regulator [Herbiconiux sp. CPCC 205763]|uniref:MarR family transcriptional regulator n=1 Tax=Herbiconiux aconitum TaxID=2970913 RepID=A0ABT2GKL7_9MICO|nr:MarR family transcriptional regulator [Herbiconiux aconitum]MCS5716676.1 MarR family transcriptional regulator [Herbiconiux aconitum]
MNSYRLSADELATWRSFIEVASDLSTVFGAQLQKEADLSPGDYAVLLALSEADEHHLRSSELAATIAWERSRLSHHLARMEKRDLLRRDECLTDNRGAEIVLTEAGAEAFRRASVPHLKAIKTTFVDALTPAQLHDLAGITAALRDHLENTRS